MKSKEELEKEPMPYDNETPKKCPKCGNWFLSYPALSRRDNKTYICPDCGVKEAMEDYMSSIKKEGLEEATAKALLEDPENEALTKPLTEGVDWSYYDKFEDLVNKYMPDQGEGETFASQIVTAVNKLIYKWYNDGDVFDNVNSGLNGWANDLSSYANWLYKYAPGDVPQILKRIYDITEEDDYEVLLRELADYCLNENFLDSLEKSKQGSIYDCEGPFEFNEHWDDEDEDEYYNEDDNFDEDEEEDLDESKKLNEGVNNLTIRTGLTDRNAYDVLSSVEGQLSDGIWENSPGMDRFWQHMSVDYEGSEVVAKFDTSDYSSGFRGKDELQIKKWLANKVKQIVKEEGLDWKRDNTERVSYMHGSVTVQDAYRVYDKLLGRKDYIPDPNKKEEAKEVETKKLNKEELLNKLEDYVLNQYTVFNEDLYEFFNDIQLNDKDNNKRSIFIYFDNDQGKFSVTVGAAGARTFVDTVDEIAQFINAEIAKVNAQDEEVKKLATEGKKYPNRIKTSDGYILTKVDDGTYENSFIPTYINEAGSEVLVPDIEKYEIIEESDEIKTDLGTEPGSDEEAKIDEIEGRNFKDEFNALSKEEQDKYKELIPVNQAGLSGDKAKALAEQYGLDAGILYWVANIGKFDLNESSDLDKDHDAYLKRMDKQYKTFCRNLELDEKDPDDALSALDELEGQFGDENGEYQELREFIYNELLESKEIKTEGTKQKRISHYNEFDNGHVLHAWYEMSNEEAEEKAKQASIENPNDVYYVQYDDIMNPSSELRWFRGKQYTIDTIDKEGSEYFEYRNSKKLKDDND